MAKLEDYRKYLNKDAFRWDKQQLTKAVDRLGTALYNVAKREAKKFGYKLDDVIGYPVEQLKVSPALKGIIHTIQDSYDGNFKSGSLNRNQLLNKYTYINQAFQYTTLRYKGYLNWVEKEKQHAKANFGNDIPEGKIELLWDLYHDFKSRYKEYSRTEHYKSIKETVTIFVKDLTEKGINVDTTNYVEYSEALEELKSLYEKRLKDGFSLSSEESIWSD